jgi:hypothetical protein
LVWGPFSSLDIGTYIQPTFGLLYSVLGPNRCPNAPKQYRKKFSGCLGPFLLQEWAY